VRRIPLVWLGAPLAIVALVVISTSALDVNAIQRGLAATVASVALIVGIEAFPERATARVLSWAPIVYLGRVSYGTYLWHWPVIFVALAVTDDRLSPTSTFVLAAALATGLASLSYQVLERPIRATRLLDRVNPVVVAVGLTVSVVSAFVIIPAVIDPYQGSAAAVRNRDTQGLTPMPDVSLLSIPDVMRKDLHGATFPNLGLSSGWNCAGRSLSPCTIVHGSGPHVLLVGDSQAWSLFPTFIKMAQDHDLTLSVAADASCPWQQNLTLDPAQNDVYRQRGDDCTTMKRDLYTRVVRELSPDVIVAVGLDYGQPRALTAVLDDRGQPQTPKDPGEFLRLVRADTQRSLEALTAHGAKVVMLGTPPVAKQTADPTVCMARARFVEDCRFIANEVPTTEELLYRSLADNKTTYMLDVDRLICPYMPICDPIVNGQVVRHDYAHISAQFAVTIAEPFYQALRSSGALGSG